MLRILQFLLVTLIYGVMSSQQPHSNIDVLASLRNHNYGIGGKSTVRDKEYDFCIAGILEQTSKDDIFGPFYKFALEFTQLSLPCSPCPFSGRPNATWMKLSFENQKTELESNDVIRIENDDSLVFRKAITSDFGTYYCIIEGFVGYIWSLEIEPFQYFEIFKTRHWQNNQMRLGELKISTKLEPWSLCNKCNRVGKRHRIGYCYVELDEEIEDSEVSKYRALQVYKKGLSCNLFLLLHPEMDPDTIEALEKKPVLLIGYCKTPCDYFEISPEILYTRVHPQIHLIYQEQLQMKADLELEKLKLRNKGKLGFVPGKPTAFEGLMIILLLALQFYIVLHICKHRWKAR